ncbi:hypothetical protein, partial [Streptomyces sp. NPDC059010]|uniref:hypothetical protein n=1 Tax=Streptomyces sp. NPDC059010 TaxID=3346695 RepID=UPI003675BE97
LGLGIKNSADLAAKTANKKEYVPPARLVLVHTSCRDASLAWPKEREVVHTWLSWCFRPASDV